MLKRQNRLTKRKEFAYIYKNGSKINSKNLSIVIVPSKKQDFRVGFSVNNKIGKAVVRNKIKRRLREIVKKQSKNIKNNQNFVIVAHPTILECDFHKMEEEVLFLLKKGKMLNEQIFDGDWHTN